MPHGCKEGHLIGHSRHGGVSLLVDCIRGFIEGMELNPFWAVGVTCFMVRIAIRASNWGVDTGGSLYAHWEGARVVSGFVGAGTNGGAGVILAERSWVSIGLAFAALCASSVGDIDFQLTLSVTYDDVLAANSILLDITDMCHNNCRAHLVLSTFRGSKPAWRLSLDQLGIVGRDTLRNVGFGDVGWDVMQQELTKSLPNFHSLAVAIVHESVFDN